MGVSPQVFPIPQLRSLFQKYQTNHQSLLGIDGILSGEENESGTDCGSFPPKGPPYGLLPMAFWSFIAYADREIEKAEVVRDKRDCFKKRVKMFRSLTVTLFDFADCHFAEVMMSEASQRGDQMNGLRQAISHVIPVRWVSKRYGFKKPKKDRIPSYKREN